MTRLLSNRSAHRLGIVRSSTGRPPRRAAAHVQTFGRSVRLMVGALVVTGLATGLAACSKNAAAEGGAKSGAENAAAKSDAPKLDPYELVPRDQPVSDEARNRVVDLIEKLRPLDATLTSDHHDRWFKRNKLLVEELERGEPEIGYAALHAFANFKERDYAIRRTLLRIGAHCAPEEARNLLEALTFTYGFYIEDRTEALLLLAETSPELYLDRAEQYLRRRGMPRETVPDDEFFARGWVIACEKAGRSPVDVMADVATNLMMQPYARVIALRSLGEAEPTELSRAALETCLTESTGDGYVRRIAAQCVLQAFPRESACDLLSLVLSREADANFARFLDDMLQLNCR